jgi:hypothetical protein
MRRDQHPVARERVVAAVRTLLELDHASPAPSMALET